MSDVEKRVTEIDLWISRHLLGFRKAYRLKRIDIISKIGITQQQLRKYETGINRVPASKLILLVDAFPKQILHYFLYCKINKNSQYPEWIN